MEIKKIDEWISKNGIFFNAIAEPEIMTYPFPDTIDDADKLFSEIIFKPPRRKSNRLFYACLEDFYIVTSSGRIIDKTLKTEIEEFFDDKTNISNVDKNSIYLDVGIHLVSKWGGTNYWHWMAESLSRLCLLDNIPQNVFYIINSLDNNFVVGSLKSMGITSDKCIEIDKVNSIYCKRLLVPSKMGDFDKKGLHFIRNKIKSAIDPKNNSPKRLFISRNKNRIVQNEQEVMELLNKYGFERINCEKLSFEEQVKMFYNTEVVIAPHGAGLTNLLFVKDNAKVLELRSPKYFGRCYYYLSRHLGFPYYSLYGKGDLPKSPQQVSESLGADMYIGIDRLQKTLDFMGIKCS